MAVAFRALTQADSFSNTLSAGKPAGVVDGDVLLAFVVNDGTSMTITPPSGWTLLEGPIASGASANLWVYWKSAFSEPGSWTWTTSTGSNWFVVTLAYSGGGAINQHANTVTAASTTPTGASVTTTVANCMIVDLMAVRASAFPATPGTSYTERREATSTNLSTLLGYVEDIIKAVAGAIAPAPTYTAAGGSGFAAVTVAIAPAGGGGGGGAPVNSVAPVVSGNPQVGSVLSCTTGTWS